jgi:hypothetical protein
VPLIGPQHDGRAIIMVWMHYAIAMPRGVKMNHSDEDIRAAIRQSRSWREVLRVLGYRTASNVTLAGIRERGMALECDVTHFGPRSSWTDDDLARALQGAQSWTQVVGHLGIRRDGSAVTRVKERAQRLMLDTSHIGHPAGAGTPGDTLATRTLTPGQQGTRTEGVVLAALLRRGYDVLIPFGVARYDLVIEGTDGFKRVQCKTARVRGDVMTFKVCSTPPGGTVRNYVGQIDYIGVYLPDLDEVYMIPVEAVGDCRTEASFRLRPSGTGRHYGTRIAADYRLVAQ